MKYLIQYRFEPAMQPAIAARFLDNRGAPPSGVTMLGRWHGMNGQGVTVVESDDEKAMYLWHLQWADLMQIDTTPCVDDPVAGTVLHSMRR